MSDAGKAEEKVPQAGNYLWKKGGGLEDGDEPVDPY